MAHLPRGLCVALVVWLALSRSSTAGRTESPNSAQWWHASEFAEIQKTAQNLRKAGDLVGLEKLYVKAVEQARSARNLRAQASYLTALGNTYVLLFRYPEAISSYAKARDLAHANSDWLAEGGASAGLSAVYLLVGDWPAARESTREGLEVSKRLPSPPYYTPQLKLQNARLNAGGDGTVRDILDAIESLRKLPNEAMEAEAWDLLGEERLRRRDMAGAESALDQAFRIRKLHASQDLRLSYWRLGALRLQQRRLEEAERFTTAAMDLMHLEGSAVSARNLLLQRGLIQQARGDDEAALRDFEAAARSAEHWRQAVPPLSRSSLAAADTEADRQVFRTFIEASARKAIASGEEKWVRKSFLAAERNRAFSLHQSAALAEVWRRKLPARYWQTLADLRQEESRQVQSNGVLAEESRESNRLHLALSEMEATAGLGYSPNKFESFSSDRSLSLFQKGLRNSELFLSFYTGAEDSYVWAVRQGSIHIYRLPGESRLDEGVRQFRRGLMGRQATARVAGEQLYQTLFGQLSVPERQSGQWVLSLSGPLFELPFAALRTTGRYLVEAHSLQTTPSATWLRESQGADGRSGYVGVGDPVYNWADERLRPADWTVRTLPYQIPGQLNRLVGSGEELRRVGRAWGKSGVTLEGTRASRGAFLQAVSENSPSHVYLATHVVASSTRRDEAFLAFSVGHGGSPELLGTADIAMLKIPGALVVMSGCSSGSGKATPGAGLLGLTRAWLSAGARAVVATAWPMEDSHGDLLPAFYEILSRNPAASAAEALRRAQLKMIHSGTWQADPGYWAAFQITGGVQ